MKKFSIFLALIMALSCFSFAAFAEETSAQASETTTTTQTTVAETTTTAETTTEVTTAIPAEVIVTVVWQNLENSKLEAKEDVVLNYTVPAGGKLTAADIITAVKNKLDENGNALIDTEEYVLSDTVVAFDSISPAGYKFLELEPQSGEAYEFEVYAMEINDIEVFSSVLSEEISGMPWQEIVDANVTLIDQILNGFMAAVDSITKPEENTETNKTEVAEPETTVEDDVETTPDTGASAVAGASVVVLALSAATAAVLRKKED